MHLFFLFKQSAEYVVGFLWFNMPNMLFVAFGPNMLSTGQMHQSKLCPITKKLFGNVALSEMFR